MTRHQVGQNPWLSWRYLIDGTMLLDVTSPHHGDTYPWWGNVTFKNRVLLMNYLCDNQAGVDRQDVRALQASSANLLTIELQSACCLCKMFCPSAAENEGIYDLAAKLEA